MKLIFEANSSLLLLFLFYFIFYLFIFFFFFLFILWGKPCRIFAEIGKEMEKLRCSAYKRHGCMAVVLPHLLSRWGHKIYFNLWEVYLHSMLYGNLPFSELKIFVNLWENKTHRYTQCIYSSSTVLVILCSVTHQRAAFAYKGVIFPFYTIRPWPVFRQFLGRRWLCHGSVLGHLPFSVPYEGSSLGMETLLW